jgi:carbon-monoxide dehydrogenase medium subunit
VKSAPFAYQHAASLADAIRACGNGAVGIKVMGGGQSLGPMLNMRLVRAALLVDVSGASDLSQAERRGGSLFIGGALTHAQIEDGMLDAALGSDATPLAQMLRHVAGTIAYRAVRNRGTLAGSLAHADPAADWVLAMAALDAQLQCVSANGTRQVAATQFMSGAFTTALAEGELLAGVLVPLYSADMRWGYKKFCRKTGEFAEASCAVVLDPQRGIARIFIGALDGAPASLPGLAAQVARLGADALGDAAVKEAVDQAAPSKDAVDRRLIEAAVKRAVKQALGVDQQDKDAGAT